MAAKIAMMRDNMPHLSDKEILDILERDKPTLKEIRAAARFLHQVI